MSDEKQRKVVNEHEQSKTATKNQWTNNNLKYYPDKRERQDGPGGN